MNNKEILKLFEDCDFTDFNYDNALQFLPDNNNNNYDFYQGASKLVIAPFHEDYVIKLPLRGDYTYDEDGHCCFAEFEVPGASKEHKYDHCAKEITLYALAKKKHVADLLIKNIYIGEVNDEPIYIQKRVTPFDDYYDCAAIFEDDFNELDYHTQEDIEAMIKSYKKSPWVYDSCDIKFNMWLVDVYNYYGEKKFFRILDFIFINLSDLHSQNYGYLNNKPVIFDYADYYGRT